MTKVWNFLIIMAVASGCTKPRLEMMQDAAGHTTCRTQFNHLQGEVSTTAGEVIFKHTQGESSTHPLIIKGLLKITQKGKREYAINPEEALYLYIDETRYPLEVAHTFKDPKEVIEHYYASIPSGAAIAIGIAKEVTVRQIAFFIDHDLLTKLSQAKKARLEVVSITKENTIPPIVLTFQPQNIQVIQEFKNQCIKSQS